MFLRPKSLEYDNHTICSDLRLASDHALLTVDILIFEEKIQTRKHMLIENSKEENKSVNKLIEIIKEINTANIHNEFVLE